MKPPAILIFLFLFCLFIRFLCNQKWPVHIRVEDQVSCSHKKSKGTEGFERSSLLYIGQCLVKQAPAVLLCPNRRDYVVCISDISEFLEIVCAPHTLLFGLQEANMFWVELQILLSWDLESASACYPVVIGVSRDFWYYWKIKKSWLSFSVIYYIICKTSNKRGIVSSKCCACVKSLFHYSSGHYSEKNSSSFLLTVSHLAALQTETCSERQRSVKPRLALMLC